MVAYTTTYSFAKPTVGDDEDVWGGYLNGNFDTLESLLKGTTALTAINVTGNITVGGNVDGRDIAADGSKLDGIESGATADQTKSDIDALGINAATLDSLDSTQFLRSDADDTMSGDLTVTGGVSLGSTSTSDGILSVYRDSYPEIRFYKGSTEETRIGSANSNGSYTAQGDFYVYDPTGFSMRLVVPISGTGSITRNNGAITVWDSGNDGSGSGLDADTVDGIQASSFLRSDADDSTSGVLTSTNSHSGSGGITVNTNSHAYMSTDRGGTTVQAGYQWKTNGTANWYNYISTSSAELKWYTTSNVMTLTTSGSLSTTPQGTLWGSSNDGSGSGLDADTVDGLQASSFLRSDAADSTSSTITFGGNIVLGNAMYHSGDADTFIQFGTDAFYVVAGNNTEITVTPTGVQLGDSGNGYFQPVSGDYGSIQIDGGAHGGWEGYSIGGRAVFMHNNVNTTGIWNDVNNHWFFAADNGGAANLYYNGSNKIQTTNTGANIDGDLNAVDNIYVANAIYHEGDTNTYVAFGTDVVDIRAGGVSTHYMASTYTSTAVPFYNYAIFYEDYDALSGTSVTVNCDTAQAFSLTMTGNTTFTFNSVSNAWSTGFVLELTGNGGTVTWPTSVDWAGGTAPDAPASGETDIYVFWTRDGGTTWYGVLSVDAAA